MVNELYRPVCMPYMSNAPTIQDLSVWTYPQVGQMSPDLHMYNVDLHETYKIPCGFFSKGFGVHKLREDEASLTNCPILTDAEAEELEAGPFDSKRMVKPLTEFEEGEITHEAYHIEMHKVKAILMFRYSDCVEIALRLKLHRLEYFHSRVSAFPTRQWSM